MAKKALIIKSEKTPKFKSEERKALWEDLWSWKEGAPTLAPESDPAPAINAPEQMFEAQPQPEPEKQNFFDPNLL